ncbi:MAG TPA: hypothetical protein DCZ91_17745 [Lachnospiraceae bacterium]|nr:hypothetical protein [Lachnospiraceae bacterium]
MTGKKRFSMITAAALLMVSLTGCAENQIPDLSGDEIQAIGEYVAVTMMKYDINHRSRLMDLTVLDEDYVPEDPTETQEPEEPSGMAPVDDTPVVDSAGKEEQAAVSSYTLEEVAGLPEGVEVAFTERGIYDNYPEEGDFFSLNASAGRKLLVLHFSITNTGEQEQNVDILGSGAVFSVTVNETYTRRALTVMALNDLSAYEGTVAAGEKADAILVIEVDADMAENISSVSLQVRNEDKVHTMKLE